MRHIKFYWPLLIGAPLLLAFLVIATLLTSARYEQNQQVWLDQLNQTPGLEQPGLPTRGGCSPNAANYTSIWWIRRYS